MSQKHKLRQNLNEAGSREDVGLGRRTLLLLWLLKKMILQGSVLNLII